MDESIDKNREILNSWKEISRYLDRGLRTCQRWEANLGLPVYRFNESTRSKVFAYKNEINSWLKNRIKNNGIEENILTHSLKNKIIPRVAIGIILFSFIFYFVGTKFSRFQKLNSFSPTTYRIQNDKVELFDSNNSNLWSFDINSQVMRDFDLGNKITQFTLSELFFRDFDGDGFNEVLFYEYTQDTLRNILISYDNDGNELWKKTFSSQIKYNDPTLETPPYFHIFKMDIMDVLGDSNPEVLTIWKQSDRFPSAFVIYDNQGNEKFVYEHTGHLNGFRIIADSKGKNYVLLNGINNLCGGDGGLALIDLEDMEGGLAPPYDVPKDINNSQKDWKKYIPEKTVKAKQKYYVRFKRTPLFDYFNHLWLSPEIYHVDSEKITVCITSNKCRLYFEFDYDLNLRKVYPNIQLEKTWAKAFSEGLILYPLDELISDIHSYLLYWDGNEWVTKPSVISEKAFSF